MLCDPAGVQASGVNMWQFFSLTYGGSAASLLKTKNHNQRKANNNSGEGLSLPVSPAALMSRARFACKERREHKKTKLQLSRKRTKSGEHSACRIRSAWRGGVRQCEAPCARLCGCGGVTDGCESRVDSSPGRQGGNHPRNSLFLLVIFLKSPTTPTPAPSHPPLSAAEDVSYSWLSLQPPPHQPLSRWD